jgi:hypothetical protein
MPIQFCSVMIAHSFFRSVPEGVDRSRRHNAAGCRANIPTGWVVSVRDGERFMPAG